MRTLQESHLEDLIRYNFKIVCRSVNIHLKYCEKLRARKTPNKNHKMRPLAGAAREGLLTQVDQSWPSDQDEGLQIPVGGISIVQDF